MYSGKTTAIIGGQYGSEAKGVVSAHMADQFDICVRVGAPNAGHSFVHDGKEYKMQQIPCGWINKDAYIIIGAGGLVNLDILEREIKEIELVDSSIRDRLKIDAKCGVLEHRHHEEEGGVNGEMHERIGSTGEGVGPVRRDKISRNPEVFKRVMDIRHDTELAGLSLDHYILEDTAMNINASRWKNASICLEGTQGFGLSITHGDWPYVTSSDTTAASLAADVGIPPHHLNEVISVFRTFPIRVAGNSGPLNKETDWDSMSKTLGKKVEERTTVTKKPRRIGEWDNELASRSIAVNRPHWVALTFLDYLNPDDEGVTSWDGLSETSKSFVQFFETYHRIPVKMLGTGYDSKKGWSYIERG